MSDGGMAAHCPASSREQDLIDAHTAGEKAERALIVAYLETNAERLRRAGSDAAANVAALAQSIRTGLADAAPTEEASS